MDKGKHKVQNPIKASLYNDDDYASDNDELDLMMQELIIESKDISRLELIEKIVKKWRKLEVQEEILIESLEVVKDLKCLMRVSRLTISLPVARPQALLLLHLIHLLILAIYVKIYMLMPLNQMLKP